MDLHRYLPPAISLSLLSIAILVSTAHSVCVPIDSIASTPVSVPPIFSPVPQANSPDGGASAPLGVSGTIGDFVHANLENDPVTGDLDPKLLEMCNSTDYSTLCLSTLVPLISDMFDKNAVIRMAVKAATDYTQLALLAAEKIAADPSISSRLVPIISDCRDSYNDALENFSDALESLPEKDTGTMSSMLSAAITDFSDIDDFLDGFTTPLPEYNQKLVQLTSNCLAIVSFCYPNNY